MSVKKILFVDDEVMVLNGLKRMLHRYKNEWLMYFAEGGRAAIGILEHEDIQVVVTDMKMPEIDGYDLLLRVKDRWPHIVRIVLSGHSERESIVKTATLAHQYLSKPSSSELIKETIDKALHLNDILFNENARRVLSQIDALPSPPDLYNKIIQIIESPTGSISQVGKLVAQDIGISANILKQVNSSFWGLPQKVTTPEMAVNMLGSDLIRSLVLNSHILRSIPVHESTGFSVKELMNQSMIASRLGKELAILEGLPTLLKDAASISGLFHDIGELILDSYFPQSHKVSMEVANKKKIHQYEAESEVLGVMHQELGAYLLGLWGMSVTIVEAVAKHHNPVGLTNSPEHIVVLICAAASEAAESESGQLSESLIAAIDQFVPGRSARWKAKIETISKGIIHE